MKIIDLVEETESSKVDEIIFSKQSRVTRFEPDDQEYYDNNFFIVTGSQNEYVRLQDCEIDNLIEALTILKKEKEDEKATK